MYGNQLDFVKISKALKDTYKILEPVEISNHLIEAQEEYLNALSHATAIKKDWLKYIQE
jgi:hypothetical protein